MNPKSYTEILFLFELDHSCTFRKSSTSPCFLAGQKAWGITRPAGFYQDSVLGQQSGCGMLLSSCAKPRCCLSSSRYRYGNTSVFLLAAETPWFSLLRPRNERCPPKPSSRCYTRSDIQQTCESPHLSPAVWGWGLKPCGHTNKLDAHPGNHRHIWAMCFSRESRYSSSMPQGGLHSYAHHLRFRVCDAARQSASLLGHLH